MSAETDERISDLERRVREHRRERDMCGPFPHNSEAAVDKVNKDNTEVPCALGSVSAHTSVLPGQAIPGAVSKASYVQVRRLDGEQEATRTKFHEAIEPPGLYRNDGLSPAYFKPDEGIWDQSYLAKAL